MEKNICSFAWRNIICRYGIPRVLVSDNGKQFNNSAFRDFCSELGIKNHYSSPAYPQANGQVEVTNRSLLKIIKTRLEGAKGIWLDELLSVLWAYRTIARTLTGEMPFQLAYGGRTPTISRRWTDGGFSTHGTQSTFGNTTSKEMDGDFPLFPSLFNFIATSFLLF